MVSREIVQSDKNHKTSLGARRNFYDAELVLLEENSFGRSVEAFFH